MKTLASFSLGLVALTLSGLAHAAGDGAFEQVERGRYLATVAALPPCHPRAPPVAKRFLAAGQ
ncbi:MAG: cytochrome c, partial [Ewingella sp.]|nr:cytochrome c [Ewingella sp.]